MTKNTLKVEFLGGEIAVPVAAFRLAAANNSPIAILLCHKQGNEQYIDIAGIINLEKGLNRKNESYVPYGKQYIECLEKYVSEKPFDYYNFFNIWDIKR